MFRSTITIPQDVARPRAGLTAARYWLLTLAEWPLLALLALLILGTFIVAALPLHYTINIGYQEGWYSDQPFMRGWNTPEPENAAPDQLSYRWTSDDSWIELPGLGARPLIATIEQLAASANPQVTTGALFISGANMAFSQPLDRPRTLHVFVPPEAAANGRLRFVAPTFTPPGDPRILGANIAGMALESLGAGVPPLHAFWPVLLLPIAWSTARRWSVGRGAAAIAGCVLVALLLAAWRADPLRFALAGRPLLIGAVWGMIVGAAALWLIERYAPRLGVQPSAWLARSIALIVCWLMLLRYGGKLYPESMIGDLGFHVNRQTEVIGGLIHLVSKHRGINFPYPSAVYVLLAPLRLLPFSPYTLVEWADALFGALGVLPVAYLALRALRNERTTLLITTVYALLAPAMMALWWSFLAHIWTQEMIPLLVAVIVGGWHLLGTRRGVALTTLVLCLIFFGHFGLFINVSVLLAGLLPLLWWRYRSTPQVRSVYGLALAFVIAEALALGLFYSGYINLIVEKLVQFGQGGMGAVQGGRDAIGWRPLLRSLVVDGFVKHYAIIGVPLALLGGYWLWQRQRGSPVVWLFWGTLVVALVQALIPFLTSSTITTRWLSFCAWVIAVGVGVVLARLWERGRLGQSAAVLILVWFGGTTLWLWVQAMGYRIRPIEPF